MELDRIEQNVIDAYLAMRLNEPETRVSVTSLSARAHISRTTFYQHFDSVASIPELIQYAILHDVRGIFHDFEYIDLSRIDRSDASVPMFERVFEYIEAHRSAFCLLMIVEPDDPFLMSYSNQVRTTVLRVLGDSLDSTTAQVVASLCLGGFQNLTFDWLRGTVSFTPEELAYICTRTLIATAKEWKRLSA